MNTVVCGFTRNNYYVDSPVITMRIKAQSKVRVWVMQIYVCQSHRIVHYFNKRRSFRDNVVSQWFDDRRMKDLRRQVITHTHTHTARHTHTHTARHTHTQQDRHTHTRTARHTHTHSKTHTHTQQDTHNTHTHTHTQQDTHTHTANTHVWHTHTEIHAYTHTHHHTTPPCAVGTNTPSSVPNTIHPTQKTVQPWRFKNTPRGIHPPFKKPTPPGITALGSLNHSSGYSVPLFEDAVEKVCSHSRLF